MTVLRAYIRNEVSPDINKEQFRHSVLMALLAGRSRFGPVTDFMVKVIDMREDGPKPFNHFRLRPVTAKDGEPRVPMILEYHFPEEDIELTLSQIANTGVTPMCSQTNIKSF